jgi:conjugal transfer pilus assembly protein TraF
MTRLALLSLASALGAAAVPLLAQPPADANRDAFYCDERKLGSWFYCNSEEAKRKAREQARPASPAIPATERMAQITAKLDELKARAILEPTSENIVSYIRFQREQLDRASTFADVWGRSIWQNPDLDYTLERPVSTLAKQTWAEDRKAQREGSMAALTERYGVFYFYSSSCSACRTFSPVMRALSDTYGLEVLAVSMDGGPNEGFPNYVVDSGQYQRMGLQGGAVPALVLFDTQTRKPIPIGYGVMAADDVMQRIFYLTQIEPGSDY